MLEGSDPSHALFDSHRRRPADQDGATRPFRSAVLYFRLEDQVPETHLLQFIEKHISFAFVREKVKASYSDTGRPSIDPVLLLRILLIGYLYGHQRTETGGGTAHAPGDYTN
jgi:transposase